MLDYHDRRVSIHGAKIGAKSLSIIDRAANTHHAAHLAANRHRRPEIVAAGEKDGGPRVSSPCLRSIIKAFSPAPNARQVAS